MSWCVRGGNGGGCGAAGAVAAAVAVGGADAGLPGMPFQNAYSTQSTGTRFLSTFKLWCVLYKRQNAAALAKSCCSSKLRAAAKGVRLPPTSLECKCSAELLHCLIGVAFLL